jgi:hypothetical protein
MMDSPHQVRGRLRFRGNDENGTKGTFYGIIICIGIKNDVKIIYGALPGNLENGKVVLEVKSRSLTSGFLQMAGEIKGKGRRFP